jgi:branched-chain amino acid transport system permease protein
MGEAIATPRPRSWTLLKSRRYLPVVLLFVVLALVPVAAAVGGSPFLIRVFTRVLIFAIAAVALNLVLGFGGLMSLLHAGLFGIGAYTVAILAQHDFAGELFLNVVPGTSELLVSLPIALLMSVIASALLGIVSLRTSGAYFIMITLAFNQMLYYFFVSLQKYGGDDGLQVLSSTTIAGFDSTARIPFYYVCLATLALTVVLISRIVDSRFGLVLRATAQNEGRVVALGISPLRYKVIAFVISGAITGLAGGLWTNGQQFVSPADMSWIRSGDFVLMAVLGGTAYVAGPVVGASAYLLIELVLSLWTTYWQLPFGLLIVLVVVVLRNGLVGAGRDLIYGLKQAGDG